jgi:hypothetical protein
MSTNHPNRSQARDQNGNPLRRNIKHVRHADGREGFIATCWFGFNPATSIRDHVYKTRKGAENADVSDDYDNSDMLAFNARRSDWQPY